MSSYTPEKRLDVRRKRLDFSVQMNIWQQSAKKRDSTDTAAPGWSKNGKIDLLFSQIITAQD